MILDRITRNDFKLIREGTAAGPVTEEMVLWAKQKYAEILKQTNSAPLQYGWHDWIPQARQHYNVAPWLRDTKETAYDD